MSVPSGVRGHSIFSAKIAYFLGSFGLCHSARLLLLVSAHVSRRSPPASHTRSSPHHGLVCLVFGASEVLVCLLVRKTECKIKGVWCVSGALPGDRAPSLAVCARLGRPPSVAAPPCSLSIHAIHHQRPLTETAPCFRSSTTPLPHVLLSRCAASPSPGRRTAYPLNVFVLRRTPTMLGDYLSQLYLAALRSAD